MLDKYIELLKPKVNVLFADDLTGHDISHLERTMKIALFLQKHEGGDFLVIGVAAFLHDIHRIISSETGIYCLPKDSLIKVKEILDEVEFPGEKTESVLEAIEYHEEYYWNKTKEHNLETKIVQDADNLDAVGALGIARTIQLSTTKNVGLYDPNVPINENEDYHEKKLDASIVHHFYHKILKMDQTMNTDAAKKLAKKRSSIAKLFVQKLMEEIELTDLD